MPYKANISSDGYYIFLKFFDEVTVSDLISADEYCMSLGKKHNIFRSLTDISEMEPMHDLIDLHNVVDNYEVIPGMRSLKLALLISKDKVQEKMADFYKDTAMNRGIEVKIFDDFDTAILWLYKTDKYTL